MMLLLNCCCCCFLNQQGYKYWRFDNGVLDDDYPRDISVGFDKIPDHVDAAFALPASGHHGKERVYFFKGAVKCCSCYRIIFLVQK